MRFKGIALSGKMKSGKDTTAHNISAKNSSFQRFAFADELKRMATDSTGVDFTSQEAKQQHRMFLIALGQAYRTFDPLFWVRRTLNRIQEDFQLDPTIIPVITDLRFKNEAKALRKKGFMLVRLNASHETIVERGGQILDDESETDLDLWGDWDLVVSTEDLLPDRVSSLVIDVFNRSNANEGLLSQLRELPKSDLKEVMRELLDEGRIIEDDLHVD